MKKENIELSPFNLKDYFIRKFDTTYSSMKDFDELPGFRGGKFTQQSKEINRFPYEKRANYCSQHK